MPFTPGALLQVITVPPPDPGPLAVYRPLQTPESPMDLLSSFGLVSADTKLLSQTAAKTVALVSIHSYGYRAELSPTSYGYHLKLVLLNAVQPSSVPLPPFDAGANARIFLNKYRLAPALNLDTVTALPDGDRTATFSEWAPFQLVGARASVTFSVRGVLRLADVRWVDISRADQAPGSPFALALQEVAAGQGSVHTTGALPDATSTITASTIIYVPVNDTDGIYYEPVYRLSGYTTSLVPFYLYVPAIDRSYLR